MRSVLYKLFRIVCVCMLAVLVAFVSVSAYARINTVEQDYDKVFAVIESAAANHEKTVVFDGGGASVDVVEEIFTNASPNKELGVYSKRKTQAMLMFDRYAVNLDKCSYKWGSNAFSTAVKSIDLGYYLNEKQVAKSERIVAKVAAKALEISDAEKRLKYVHDWVIENAAYVDIDSEQWGSSKKYGVSNTLINSCSGVQLLAHRGMCHSYVLTFLRICDASQLSGLRYVGCITDEGRELNHAVAYVKIDESKRYIDVTWDEPLFLARDGSEYEVPDQALDRFFLKTKAYMVETGHRFE